MALYYFDTWHGDKVVSDNEGVECADDEAACGAARAAKPISVADGIGKGKAPPPVVTKG